MFQNKICSVISWDSSGNVSGVNLDANATGSGYTITGSAFTEQRELLQDAIRDTFTELAPNPDNTIVLTGHIENSVCFEMLLPQLSGSDLQRAIVFELSRHLPLPVENIIWHYRIIDDNNNDSSMRRLRIFAVKEQSWNHLISEIDAATIKADAIFTPFMALDPLLENANIFMPEIEPDFVWTKAPSADIRQMTPLQSCPKEAIPDTHVLLKDFIGLDAISEKHGNTECFLPALIAGAYSLGKSFKTDAASMLPLPRKMAPQRFKLQRILAIAMGVAVILLTGTYIARKWYDTAMHFHSIESERRKVLKKIDTVTANIKAEQGIKEKIDKISKIDATSSTLLHSLHYLSTKIPKNMWITNLSSRGNLLDLTVKTDNESTNLASLLTREGKFTTESVRKRRNADGSVYIYLRLKMNDRRT